MRREVVSTRRVKPERTIPSAFGIIDTLECGHEVYTKGSQGYARYRNCDLCESWLQGTTTYRAIGDKVEKWDAKTLMPYWEDVVNKS